MRHLTGQFARYVACGLTAAAVHYAILIVLVEAGAPVVPSSCAGATVALITSYLLNYHFTFRSAGPHGATLGRFLAVSAGGWLINAGAMFLLVRTVDAHYLVLQTAAVAAMVLFNFSGYRWFAFRPAQ